MYLKRARDKMLGIVKQICYNRTFPIGSLIPVARLKEIGKSFIHRFIHRLNKQYFLDLSRIICQLLRDAVIDKTEFHLKLTKIHNNFLPLCIF